MFHIVPGENGSHHYLLPLHRVHADPASDCKLEPELRELSLHMWLNISCRHETGFAMVRGIPWRMLQQAKQLPQVELQSNSASDFGLPSNASYAHKSCRRR